MKVRSEQLNEILSCFSTIEQSLISVQYDRSKKNHASDDDFEHIFDEVLGDKINRLDEMSRSVRIPPDESVEAPQNVLITEGFTTPPRNSVPKIK